MTNEELKKKIESIIRNAKRDFAYCVPEEWAVKVLADALIAAKIGDVSELKNHRLIAEYSLVPDDDNPYIIPNVPLRVTQLYSGEEVEQIVKEREEYKHRAEVAERALDKATELAYTYRTQDDTLSCSSCPFDSIFDRCKERGLYEDCSKRWKEELLQQAEKELTEERKKL